MCRGKSTVLVYAIISKLHIHSCEPDLRDIFWLFGDEIILQRLTLGTRETNTTLGR